MHLSRATTQVYQSRLTRSQRRFQERLWGKNLNVSKGMEHQKIRIARDDMSGVAARCKFEELVIFRIAARHYFCLDVDPLSLACQSRQETANIFLIDVAAKPFSAQYLVQFGQR
jgi:hypothetical protein